MKFEDLCRKLEGLARSDDLKDIGLIRCWLGFPIEGKVRYEDFLRLLRAFLEIYDHLTDEHQEIFLEDVQPFIVSLFPYVQWVLDEQVSSGELSEVTFILTALSSEVCDLIGEWLDGELDEEQCLSMVGESLTEEMQSPRANGYGLPSILTEEEDVGGSLEPSVHTSSEASMESPSRSRRPRTRQQRRRAAEARRKLEAAEVLGFEKLAREQQRERDRAEAARSREAIRSREEQRDRDKAKAARSREEIEQRKAEEKAKEEERRKEQEDEQLARKLKKKQLRDERRAARNAAEKAREQEEEKLLQKKIEKNKASEQRPLQVTPTRGEEDARRRDLQERLRILRQEAEEARSSDHRLDILDEREEQKRRTEKGLETLGEFMEAARSENARKKAELIKRVQDAAKQDRKRQKTAEEEDAEEQRALAKPKQSVTVLRNNTAMIDDTVLVRVVRNGICPGLRLIEVDMSEECIIAVRSQVLGYGIEVMSSLVATRVTFPVDVLVLELTLPLLRWCVMDVDHEHAEGVVALNRGCFVVTGIMGDVRNFVDGAVRLLEDREVLNRSRDDVVCVEDDGQQGVIEGEISWLASVVQDGVGWAIHSLEYILSETIMGLLAHPKEQRTAVWQEQLYSLLKIGDWLQAKGALPMGGGGHGPGGPGDGGLSSAVAALSDNPGGGMFMSGQDKKDNKTEDGGGLTE